MFSEILVSTHVYVSPYGPLMLGAVDGQLCLCYWLESTHWQQESTWLAKRFGMKFRVQYDMVFQYAISSLDRYFARNLFTFEIPLFFVGTPFQQDVWRALSNVAYGTTVSYKELALISGHPNAVRAVAATLPLNPLQVILPCHRVVGANGGLTGYAGGLVIKRHLLELERGVHQ